VSKARLVITAVVLEGRSQAAVARDYGVSKGWVSKLVARYRQEGESAFQPRSRRPKRSPNQTPPEVVELMTDLRDAELIGVERGCLLSAPLLDASQVDFRNWHERLPERGGRTWTGSAPDP